MTTTPDEPRVFYYDTVTTTMEVARDIEDRLRPWDSVLAGSQTEGRGQLRRHWYSPPGNIYASMLLPPGAPLDAGAASVAVGVLVAKALALAGYSARLKWPNDIVLSVHGRMAKVGGILLEEHQGKLIAGIGIDLVSAPESLRPAATFAADTLEAACGAHLPPPRELWPTLVKNMREVYKNADFFAAHWRPMAEGLLLWIGQDVEVADGQECSRGVFLGLGKDGGALLGTPDGRMEVFTGSMCLWEIS